MTSHTELSNMFFFPLFLSELCLDFSQDKKYDKKNKSATTTTTKMTKQQNAILVLSDKMRANFLLNLGYIHHAGAKNLCIYTNINNFIEYFKLDVKYI